MSIVHHTPGLLDVRAFTIHGLSVKPNSTAPIGKFGTGLKYAIATLLRLGCTVRLFIGKTEYVFFTSSGDFRGMEYQQIKMKKRNSIIGHWRYETLPYTTEYGKYWEAWQAFRELESNTRDEGGTTGVYDNFEVLDNTTTFVIDGKPYVEAYYDRDKVFLPNALTAREGDDQVQVFNEPSKHLYWRGIRVYDLDKPSIYTYNILANVDLTEDRTIKFMFQAYQHIGAFVSRTKDTRLINAVVGAKDEQFESKIDFDYSYVSPSAEFLSVVTKKRSRGGYVGKHAMGYYTKYAPSPPPSSKTLSQRIAEWAYNTDVPDEVQELLKYLLKCEIKEPTRVDPDDDSLPF